MTSIWSQSPGKLPEKLIGGMPPQAAMATIKQIVADWRSQNPSHTSMRAEALTYLMYSEGELVGSLFIEPLSPPSKPDPGETYRKKQSA